MYLSVCLNTLKFKCLLLNNILSTKYWRYSFDLQDKVKRCSNPGNFIYSAFLWLVIQSILCLKNFTMTYGLIFTVYSTEKLNQQDSHRLIIIGHSFLFNAFNFTAQSIITSRYRYHIVMHLSRVNISIILVYSSTPNSKDRLIVAIAARPREPVHLSNC